MWNRCWKCPWKHPWSCLRMQRERHGAVVSGWLGDRRRSRRHGIRLYSSIRFRRSPLYGVSQLYPVGSGGKNSHVTFCVVANLMSDSNRRILTKVTLVTVSKGCSPSLEWVDLQNTQTEHAQNTQLLSQRQVQVV